MTTGLYNIGVSGLLASQQQLATTGHNISNVNTEGYSRQRAEQNATVGLYSGGNFTGSGTYVENIGRVYNKFAYKEQLFNFSNKSNAETLNKDLSQLNEIMSFSGAAVSSSIDRFYQAMNGIADNPSDVGLRSIALSQANIVSSDFRSLNENLDNLEKSINGEIDQIAKQISRISSEIATINEQVLQNQSLTQTGKPNDLLDKRDQLLGELGQYVSVNTVEDNNGVLTVMMGNSATLVAGITPLSVSIKAGDPDPIQTELQLIGPNSTVAINGSVLGGTVAAKLEFRDEHITKLRSEMDRIAMAVSHTLNKSQSEGLDLNTQQGSNIFTDINTSALQEGRVFSPSGNTGTLDAKVNITDIGLLPTDVFEIEFDGANYQMTNKTDGSIVNLGAPGSGTYATTHGFEFIENSGAPASGDNFLIRPTENSAALMQVTLTDGTGIAASTAIKSTPNDNNVSTGKVNIINMTDPVTARTYASTTNTSLEVDVYESSPGTFSYRVFNSATPPPAATIAAGTFTTGNTAVIDMPPSPAAAAFQIEISGLPTGQGALAREKFTIDDAFGIGNGSNATAMGLTQEQGVINKGRDTFSQSLAISTSDVGSKANSADLVFKTADALFTQAYNRNQSISGVNLDEEAANLMKFQQAYQASSRIISVANTIFDTLLAAV